MPAASFNNPARQRGAGLLEGLIAMLLMAIIGMGITYVLSHSAVSQTTLNAQNLTINQLRAKLQTMGMNTNCASTTATTVTSQMALKGGISLTDNQSCTLTTVSISVNGTTKTAMVPVMTNTLTNDILGGTLTMSNNQ